MRCDLSFRYWLAAGGAFAEDVAVQRITAVDPPLLPDLNRNGMRDAGDIDMFVRGCPLRFWVNEDTAKGDDVLSPTGNSLPNASDLFVNGTLDLLNFCAIALDLTAFRENWGLQNVEYRICGEYPGYPEMNACLADVGWDELSAPQTGSVHSVDGDLLSAARLTRIDLENPEWTLPANRLQQFQSGRGIVFAEFPQWCAGSALVLKALLGDAEVFRFRLPLWITPARYMYRWYNGRHLSGQGETRASMMDTPINNPDGLENAKTLIFLHGANVSEADAEKWGDSLFKRLWHAGCRVNFVNVDWRSDIGNKANYHQNASNAFEVASQIADDVKAIPGVKVMMAHSLGNMVVSSMIQDHELVPACYLMCDSSVPAEAYDTSPSLRVPQLVHPEWEEYPTNSWAASWHWLFRNEPNDDRKHLGWPGRFANVAQYAVNFYSTGDEVLELLDDNDITILTGITSWYTQYAWHHQELWKGRGIANILGGTTWSGWNIEENLLGINKISVAEALQMSDEDFKTNTVFYCYPSSMNSPNIPLLVRGAHLAQGIPALARPTGGISVFPVLNRNSNYNLDHAPTLEDEEDENATSFGLERPNGWPTRSRWNDRWLHSDMKDVSYFYNFKFYEKVIEKGILR